MDERQYSYVASVFGGTTLLTAHDNKAGVTADPAAWIRRTHSAFEREFSREYGYLPRRAGRMWAVWELPGKLGLRNADRYATKAAPRGIYVCTGPEWSALVLFGLPVEAEFVYHGTAYWDAVPGYAAGTKG